jgi:hypothetical protein
MAELRITSMLRGGGGEGLKFFFSLVQARRLQVTLFLLMFKSGESCEYLWFFFFFNLIPDPLLESTFARFIFNACLRFESYACVVFDFSLSKDPTKSPIHQYSQSRVI